MKNKARQLNLRDLGSIALADGKGTVPSGLFLRGGKLSIFTPKACAAFCKKHHIACVIDLRTPLEAQEFPDPLPDDVEYVQIPLLKDAAVGITRETGSDPMTIVRNLRKHPEKLKEMMPDFPVLYKQIVTDEYSLGQLHKAIDKLRENAEKGICTYYHCTAGKDRTGVATMALLRSYGVSDDEIVKDFMRTNRNAWWPTIRKCVGVFLLTQRWSFVKLCYHSFLADSRLMRIALENYR